MVSLQKLANAAVVKDNFPVLAETASMVGAVQHQFMGTVGGNLWDGGRKSLSEYALLVL
jgi:CO/xanthine dehydrogenase FAD-binding subunit